MRKIKAATITNTKPVRERERGPLQMSISEDGGFCRRFKKLSWKKFSCLKFLMQKNRQK